MKPDGTNPIRGAVRLLKALGLFALLIILSPASSLSTVTEPRPGDTGAALMAKGRYREAAEHYKNRVEERPDEPVTRLRLGICLLKIKDYGEADRHIDQAVEKDKSLAAEAASAWEEEGRAALASNEKERALGMYLKAGYYSPKLRPALGMELLKAADGETEPAPRARIVAKIADWAGRAETAKASAEWFAKKLGPPREVTLDIAGWAQLATLKPGDEIYYLSAEPLRQRNEGAVRILPEAHALPVKLVLEKRDTGGKDKTPVWISKHLSPTKVYIWIIPGAD